MTRLSLVFSSLLLVLVTGIGFPDRSPNLAHAQEAGIGLSYTLIESTTFGDIDTRVYDLQLQNLTSEAFDSGSAILRVAPAFITVLDRDVSFGPVSQGETVQGDDSFSISIDITGFDPEEFDISFIWEIVYDSPNGPNEFLHEHFVGPLPNF